MRICIQSGGVDYRGNRDYLELGKVINLLVFGGICRVFLFM